MQYQGIQKEVIYPLATALMVGFLGRTIDSIFPIRSTVIIATTILIANEVLQRSIDYVNKRDQLRYSRVQLLQAASDTVILIAIITALFSDCIGIKNALFFGSWAALSISFHLGEAGLSILKGRDRHEHEHHFSEITSLIMKKFFQQYSRSQKWHNRLDRDIETQNSL